MGLLAREIETLGVTTVALAMVKELAAMVKAPRTLYLRWPFGHALGEPNRRDQQRTVLWDAFSMAALAPRPGLVVELPYLWKRQDYLPIAEWSLPSQAFTAALDRALAATQLRPDPH